MDGSLNSEAMHMLPLRFSLTVVCALSIAFVRTAAAMQPCPPQKDLRDKAEIIVEARVKSLFIGESGLLTSTGIPTRMVRTELEIKRVIKGKFAGKEAIAYGFMYPAGPLRQLSFMAMAYGLTEDDTFEWQLSRTDIAEDTGFYSLSECVYYKFPDIAERIGGIEEQP